MSASVVIPVKQRTPEWLEARRGLVTATDIAVLLGLSPYRCEADLADEKLHGSMQAETLRMRVGTAMEPLIREAYEERTGRRLRRQHGLIVHPEIPWAGASLDYRVIGEPVLMEAKWSTSRSRFADALPQDIEAQAVWQAAVAGARSVDVAVLLVDDLKVFEVPADPALFADLVRVAEDFRRRLAEGGPFARSDERIRRDYPADDGVLLPATPDLIALARELADARAAKAEADGREKTVASALRAILLGSAGVEGVLTYRKSADSTRVNWPAVAGEYRALLEPTRSVAELDAVVSIHSETKTGPRVLRLSKETNE